MVCLDTPSRIHVRRGGIIRLDGAMGTAILCHAGAVWVTLEDDSRDILIEAGESFVIDRGGLSLVCAIAGPAEVEVRPVGAQVSADVAADDVPDALHEPARAA